MSKEDMIEQILIMNPNCFKDELERCSHEHLKQIYNYWKTKNE